MNLIFVSVPGEIRNYFGEHVAMYFAFLGIYTTWLVLPAALGVISEAAMYSVHVNADTVLALFCVFNLIWANIFLRCCKRRTAELAYEWGTIRTERFEEPRAEFYGFSRSNDPVTGRMQPQYPSRYRLLKVCLVSVPAMVVALYIAYLMMLFYFWMEMLLAEFIKDDTWLWECFQLMIIPLPTIVYVFIIFVLTSIYKPIAIRLNNWGKCN